MEKLSLQKLKESLTSLEELVTCCVCLEVARRPAVQCVNDHLLCGPCRGTLPRCPTCDGVFREQLSRLARQTLERLPHPCQHAAAGCRDYLAGETDHEKYCAFRKTRCRGCGWQASVGEVLTHLHDCKKGALQVTGLPAVGYEKETRLAVDTRRGFVKATLYMTHAKDVIWEELMNDPDMGVLTFTYGALFKRKPDYNYFVKIVMTRGRDELPYKFGLDLDLEGGGSWCIPKYQTVKLLADGYLHYKVQIIPEKLLN